MLKNFKYSFYDLLRGRWTIIYFIFFLASGSGLLYLSGDISKGITSIMNVTIAIVPVISIIFGVMYYYNSREFIDLLLSQPVNRSQVFLGQYLGVSASLSLSFALGTLLSFAVYGITVSGVVWEFVILVILGIVLTFIFTAIAFCVSVFNDDKIRGFGAAILIWLYMAVIYDGIVLLIFISFAEYPLEQTAVVLTVFNPVDLARIFFLLKLDISALMGYTGAIFGKFFGTPGGMAVSVFSLVLWIVIPVVLLVKVANKKDF